MTINIASILSVSFQWSHYYHDTVLCLWWSLGIFLLLFQILGWKHSSHISRPNSQERNWLKKANYHDTCMDICVTSHGPLIHLWVSCGHMVISGGTSMNTFRRASQKGGERRDGWMALLIQWTWVWVNSMSWWWTGRPGMLQSMALQRVGHDQCCCGL